MLIDVHAFSLFVFGWFTSVKVICPWQWSGTIENRL